MTYCIKITDAAQTPEKTWFLPEKNELAGKPHQFETNAEALEIIKCLRANLRALGYEVNERNIVYEVLEIIED